jgi:arylsulfatase A-like enzyme
MKALKQNGLSFDHAYTASCMCSPSRAAFQTSQYPIVTGCTTTGSAVLPPPSLFPNLASVVTAANYSCYWIGKWHLLGPNEPGSTSGDLTPWGYQVFNSSLAWDPPDGGINLGQTYLGGGTQGPMPTNQNDQRTLANAMSFLANPPAAPWCLVVSFVNPHDAHLGFIANSQDTTQMLDAVFYDSSLWTASARSGVTNVPLPPDFTQDLSTMPRGQAFYTWATQAAKHAQPQDFANFYAYLTMYVDGQINSLLDVMDANRQDDLKNNTLVVRFADHGEMGLAHGLVEKFVNAYGQSTHVPLVFSNPIAWERAHSSDQIASTVDLLPTLADMLGVEDQFVGKFAGTSLYSHLDGIKEETQRFVHYTYDDISFDNVGSVNPPGVIRTIRSRDWVYSVYLDQVCSRKSGYSDADWEMYDLRNNPTETKNLAGTGLKEQARLDRELQRQMIRKGTAPAWYPKHWPPQATANSRGGPPPAGTGTLIHAVEDIPGLSPDHIASLRYVGIRTTDQLLARGATAEARDKLAAVVAVDAATLGRWIAAARDMATADEVQGTTW